MSPRPMFQKRHHKAIADNMALTVMCLTETGKTTHWLTCDNLAYKFAADNPTGFDRAKFMKACGTTERIAQLGKG